MEGNAVADRGRHGGRCLSDVLELRVLHVLHHGMLGRRVRVARWRAFLIFLIIVVAVLLAGEVLRTLVLVGAAILRCGSARMFGLRRERGGIRTYW